MSQRQIPLPALACSSEIAAAARHLRDISRCAVLSHIHPDGDAIGSTTGLVLGLRECGIEATGYAELPLTSETDAIPGASVLEPQERFAVDGRTVVFVDCATPDRTGIEALDLSQSPCVINIDHHVTNTRFGDLNLVDVSATATSEIVYDLLGALGSPISPEIAAALLVGISTDCGFFMYGNTTPRVLRVAAELLEHNADLNQVYRAAVQVQTPNQLRLIGAVLNHLRTEADGKIVIGVIPNALYAATGTSHRETEGVINSMRTLRSTEVLALLRDSPKGVRVSLRSSGIDVGKIALAYGGGGHLCAAGCVLPGPIEVAVEEIAAALHRALEDGQHGKT